MMIKKEEEEKEERKEVGEPNQKMTFGPLHLKIRDLTQNDVS